MIIEHTNINPNKAAHIGHLRNAILGDTFVRMLRAAGRSVEVQNYIDNTGVQVADVVVAFEHWKRSRPPRFGRSSKPRASTICAGISTRGCRAITRTILTRSNGVKRRCTRSNRAKERHRELAHLVSDAIVRAHLATMYRLNIEYDVLPRESEILHLKFWAQAFELLKERKAIYFETEGKNKGCWVMPASAFKSSR